MFPKRHLAIAVILALLLALPAAAQARPRIVPGPSRPPAQGTAKPRPPAPPVDSALLGGGALILVALLGCAGRTVTARMA